MYTCLHAYECGVCLYACVQRDMIIYVGMGRGQRSMFSVFSKPLSTLVLDLFTFMYVYTLA